MRKIREAEISIALSRGGDNVSAFLPPSLMELLANEMGITHFQFAESDYGLFRLVPHKGIRGERVSGLFTLQLKDSGHGHFEFSMFKLPNSFYLNGTEGRLLAVSRGMPVGLVGQGCHARADVYNDGSVVVLPPNSIFQDLQKMIDDSEGVKVA